VSLARRIFFLLLALVQFWAGLVAAVAVRPLRLAPVALPAAVPRAACPPEVQFAAPAPRVLEETARRSCTIWAQQYSGRQPQHDPDFCLTHSLHAADASEQRGQ
jgi:hypothetical protein